MMRRKRKLIWIAVSRRFASWDLYGWIYPNTVVKRARTSTFTTWKAKGIENPCPVHAMQIYVHITIVTIVTSCFLN